MGEIVMTGGGFFRKKIMYTLNFHLYQQDIIIKARQILANTNKLNIDFLNLKIEWHGDIN